VASLVRSNPAASIGFIGDAERINVLLSRARHGIILVGNAKCLLASKSRSSSTNHWQTVLSQPSIKVAPYIPLLCPRHDVCSEPRTAAELREVAPHGGCVLPCCELLECGHQCPDLCHPFRDDDEPHVSITSCTVRCTSRCAAGVHNVEHQCGHASVCRTVVEDKCLEGGHAVQRMCYLSIKVAECKTCEEVAKHTKRIEALRAATKKAKQELEEETARKRLNEAEKFEKQLAEMERAEAAAEHEADIQKVKDERKAHLERLKRKQERTRERLARDIKRVQAETAATVRQERDATDALVRDAQETLAQLHLRAGGELEAVTQRDEAAQVLVGKIKALNDDLQHVGRDVECLVCLTHAKHTDGVECETDTSGAGE
jgi:hypothetical protein